MGFLKMAYQNEHVRQTAAVFKLAIAANPAIRAASRLTLGTQKAGGAPQSCGSASDRFEMKG